MKDIKNNYFNINWEKVLLGELNGEIELISKSLEKYDCFSIKQKALIYETIVSSIELEYSKYKSNRMNSAFDVDARIEVLFELPNRVTEYIISIFTFVNDAKSKYPTIIKNIENNDSLSFEILQKYLENECAEYINLSVGEIVKEDNEIVKEILNGRKEAFSAQKTMDRFKRIKFKECEIKNSIDYLEWLKEWTPEKIVSHLNQYIIGQKNAKEGAATALVAHMQRIAYPELSFKQKKHVVLWSKRMWKNCYMESTQINLSG